MALGAPDRALVDLVLQAGQRRLVHHKIRDTGGLPADMVELQHGAVRLAAVHTAGPIENRPDVLGVASAPDTWRR